MQFVLFLHLLVIIILWKFNVHFKELQQKESKKRLSFPQSQVLEVGMEPYLFDLIKKIPLISQINTNFLSDLIGLKESLNLFIQWTLSKKNNRW